MERPDASPERTPNEVEYVGNFFNQLKQKLQASLKGQPLSSTEHFFGISNEMGNTEYYDRSALRNSIGAINQEFEEKGYKGENITLEMLLGDDVENRVFSSVIGWEGLRMEFEQRFSANNSKLEGI